MATPPRAAQREEAEKMLVGPGAISTKPQTRGWAGGMLAGGIVGALIGAVIGAIFYEGGLGILIGAICLAFAGGTFGFLFGGYRSSEKRIEEGRPQV